MTPDEIAALKQQVGLTVEQVGKLAERHAFREQTDFIGRSHQAYVSVMAVDDAAEAGEYTPDQHAQIGEALLDLAGLCIARLALIRHEAEAMRDEPRRPWSKSQD